MSTGSITIDPSVPNSDRGPSIFAIVRLVDWQDKDHQVFLVNYSDTNTKRWLTRSTVWALTNNHAIIMEPAKPEDIAKMALFTPREPEVKQHVRT